MGRRNAHLLSDFIGTTEVTSLNDGATNLDQMGDIKYFDNLLWLDLLVPKAILTAGEDINRDILKTQYPQYLRSLEDITNTLEYGDPGSFSEIRDIIDLQLLLAGINPQSIIYDVVWSNKTTETALERMERVQQALGSSGNTKIITKANAIQQIADDFDIEDTQAMIEAVEEESKMQACTHVNDKKQKENMEQEELEVKEEITDVSKEDIQAIEELELEATDIVIKFFDSVYENMVNSNRIILDESDHEEDKEDENDEDDDEDSTLEDEIEDEFDNAWDELEEAYKEDITNQMAGAFMLGSERAFEFAKSRLEELLKEDNEKAGKIKLNFKIFKKDMYNYLLKESGTRIKGI